MLWFFLIFIFVYGGLNAYVMARIQHALKLGHWPVLLLATALFVLLAMPFTLRLIVRPGLFEVARVTAFVGYLWFAVVLWFCFFGLVIDAVNGLAGLARVGAPLIAPRPALAIIVVGVLALALAATRENQELRVERLTIGASAMPAGATPLRVVQISDLHYSLGGGPRYLAQALKEIEALKPDLLVATGDLLDVTGALAEPLVTAFAAIKPSLGKYAVLGNHEFYIGAADSISLLEQAGFRVLRQESDVLDFPGMKLRIAGVDDPAGKHMDQAPMIDEKAVLPSPKSRAEFVLFLKHNPRVESASRGLFDLQLSGHTHGGQVFPFQLGVKLANDYFRGLYPIPEGGAIYVSRGTGCWGPQLRLFAPREITLLQIGPAPNAGAMNKTMGKSENSSIFLLPQAETGRK